MEITCKEIVLTSPREEEFFFGGKRQAESYRDQDGDVSNSGRRSR